MDDPSSKDGGLGVRFLVDGRNSLEDVMRTENIEMTDYTCERCEEGTNTLIPCKGCKRDLCEECFIGHATNLEDCKQAMVEAA